MTCVGHRCDLSVKVNGLHVSVGADVSVRVSVVCLQV